VAFPRPPSNFDEFRRTTVGKPADPRRAAAELMVDEGGSAPRTVVPKTPSPFLSGFRLCVGASSAVRSRSIVGRLEASARRQFSPDESEGEIKMGRRLYVGNLSYDTTELELREVFGKFGTVADAKVVMDRETGRPRGFAFVEMSSDQEAQNSIAELNGRELGGRALNVNEAQERSGGGGGGGGGRGGGGGGRGGGGGGGRW
jgi:cold-inducible RNA-binding protein